MNTQPHIDTRMDTAALAVLRDDLASRLAASHAVVTLAVREITIAVPVAGLLPVLAFLRDDGSCRFHMLVDVTAVDWLGAQKEMGKPKRFEVVYHLLSTEKNLRVRVKAAVEDGEPVPTAVGLFSSANWYEREVWDMFGIRFDGHPDLRRILTDYDFASHPLRKDFPLTGHVEVYYDTAEKRVAYKPVDLPQDFRRFDRQSPWDGVTGNAPLADSDNMFRKEEFK
jgi:NADH-quinone oxidoreductase subunit C